MTEDEIYELIDRELNGGQRNRALWTRAFADADGDERKAQAKYIKLRAKQLLDETLKHESFGEPKLVSHSRRLNFAEPILGELPIFHNGISRMRAIDALGDKIGVGYIDRSGKYIVPPNFSDLEFFPEGGAAAAAVGSSWADKDFDRKRWGIIDQRGNFLVEPRFSFAHRLGRTFYLGDMSAWPTHIFAVDTCALSKVTEAQITDYNFRGQPLRPVPFQEYDSQGFWDRGKVGKFGYKNRIGKWQIKPQFDYAEVFKEGHAVVGHGPESEIKYFVVDETGRNISKHQFDFVAPMPDNPNVNLRNFRICGVGNEPNRKLFHTNSRGERVYSSTFAKLHYFVNDLCAAAIDINGVMNWGLIDLQGNFVVQPQHEACAPLSNGMMTVTLNNMVGIAKTDLEWIVPPTFHQIYEAGEGMLAMAKPPKIVGSAKMGNLSSTENWELVSMAELR